MIQELSRLSVGTSGRIHKFKNSEIEYRLMVMGIHIGDVIELFSRIPIAGTSYIKAGSTRIALRKEESNTILVEIA